MTERQAERAMHKRAVIFAAVILKPSGVRRILMQILRRNVVMLTAHHAAQAREKAFGLIGASAVMAISFTVVDPRYRIMSMQNIPM